MLTTCGTVVRRVGHQEVNRATGAYIAKVVQGALVGCVARGEMPTSGAGGLLIVTAIKSQLGCWEVLDVDNALGGVWYVFTRSKHGWLPWKKGWDQSIKVITCPVYIESRIPATVSNQGAFQTGDYEEIMNKATCLSLLSNAVVVWNTMQMSRII